MEKAFAKVEELADTIKDYVNTRLESVKLSAAEKSSAVIANVIAVFVVAVVFIFFIIFAGMALAFGLGVWLGSTWLGFLIVACLYLVLGIAVWLARGKIIRMPVMNSMIQQLFKNEEEEEEYEKN